MLGGPEVISVHRLSPLFVGGDTEIGMAYVISDSLHALSSDSPERGADGRAEWSRTRRQNSLTRRGDDLDPKKWTTYMTIWP
jgi:hypothetical protein